MTFEDRESKVKFCLCWRSSVAEQLPCKQWVGGSNPPLPTMSCEPQDVTGLGPRRPRRAYEQWCEPQDVTGLGPRRPRRAYVSVTSDACPARRVRGASRRRVTSNTGGNSSAVERQPSKLGVAGSNPVSRSRPLRATGGRGASLGAMIVGDRAHVAQTAERVLGKDEVSGSIPDMGSISLGVGDPRGE